MQSENPMHLSEIAAANRGDLTLKRRLRMEGLSKRHFMVIEVVNPFMLERAMPKFSG